MMRAALLLVLSLTLGSVLRAQDNIYYTINIGTFVDAQADDFSALKRMGFLHSTALERNLSQVYLGGYQNMQSAKADLANVQSAGYTNAYIQENFLNSGRPVAVIQITTLKKGSRINWKRYADAGDLYALLEGDMLKLVVGIYDDALAARDFVQPIRQKGYKDAFIKTVNSVYLHEIGAFESGNAIKKPLIPINFEDNGAIAQTPEKGPDSYNQPLGQTTNNNGNGGFVPSNPNRWTPKSPTASKTKAAPALPMIRGKIKRRSALDLQKVLKEVGAYTAGLDGYYGPGTKVAYERFVQQNQDYRKYQLWSEKVDRPTNNVGGDRVQMAINEVPNNPGGVEGYPQAIAKGYQAYVLFSQLGPGNTVNNLMNSALKEAYLNTPPQMVPGFDYRATYAYNDLTQLILHLFYIHSAPGVNYTVPCWLSENHPTEVANANANFMGGTVNMQNCNELGEWQEIKILETIAADFSTGNIDPDIQAKEAAARTSLMLTQQPLSANLNQEMETWNTRLWQGVSIWGNADPIHKRMTTPLKVAYFQAQVRLEDYFMDKGFRENEAKGLALATLRSVVGTELERFAK
ncbi:MAG: hypothetical protein Sapg2KO_12250 [Saprospiraceae bacterium]